MTPSWPPTIEAWQQPYRPCRRCDCWKMPRSQARIPCVLIDCRSLRRSPRPRCPATRRLIFRRVATPRAPCPQDPLRSCRDDGVSIAPFFPQELPAWAYSGKSGWGLDGLLRVVELGVGFVGHLGLSGGPLGAQPKSPVTLKLMEMSMNSEKPRYWMGGRVVYCGGLEKHFWGFRTPRRNLGKHRRIRACLHFLPLDSSDVQRCKKPGVRVYVHPLSLIVYNALDTSKKHSKVGFPAP